MSTTCVASRTKNIEPNTGSDSRHATYFGTIAIPAYAAAAASTTLTNDGALPLDGDVVVIGAKYYTFRTALTTSPATVANEVLIGVSGATALDNLQTAVDTGASVGVVSVGTLANATISSSTNTNTTQIFVADSTGVAGNNLATWSTSAHLSFTGKTLAGGLAASSYVSTDGIVLSFAGVCPHNDPPIDVEIWSDTIADGYVFRYVTGTTSANGLLYITTTDGSGTNPFTSIADCNTPSAISGDTAIRFRATFVTGR